MWFSRAAPLCFRHQLYVYYGGADKVVGVASIDVDFLIEWLGKRRRKERNY